MMPNIYAILRTNPAIITLIGTRIYRHGSAPQPVETPYITWFISSGVPELQISGEPCTDRDTVQIDVWSKTDAEVVAVAKEVRKALDAGGHSNTVAVNLRETDTRLYRIGFQSDIIQPRN
jgi:hypothetical protein